MYHKKRRKSTHRRSTRHRRVSGIKDVDFTSLALVIAGGVGGRILYNKLSTSTNTTFSKLAPYSGVILGIALPMFMKSPMVKALSMGLVATGGVNMLIGLKVISGMEETVISGYKTPYRSLGYPPNVIPPRLNGVVDGEFVSKSNFSGSGLPQAKVIAGVGNNCGDGSATSYLY